MFALITILVLTAFLLSSGRTWVDAAIASRPPEQRERLRRSRENMASAVSGYVAGALTIAVIAGVATYIVLAILGVPFKGATRRAGRALLAHPARGRDHRRRADRHRHGVRGLPDGHDHLDDLGDRLPAAREPPASAADPEANRERSPAHHDRGRAVRRDAARDPGRDRGHPGGCVDPDPHARVRGPAHAVDQERRGPPATPPPMAPPPPDPAPA